MVYKKIKGMLETALEDVANKGEITSSNLELIEKLICSIKYVHDIQKMEQNANENRSFDNRPSRMYNYGYDYGYDYDYGYTYPDDMMGRSLARGRDSRGRYTNDRESEIHEIVSEMHELKHRVSDPSVKHKIDTMIKELRM